MPNICDIHKDSIGKFLRENGHTKDLDGLKQLSVYRNIWHERVIREEVKQAAKDGKTKLQFPTGETAMKIEGLGGREGVPPHVAEKEGDIFSFQNEDWMVIQHNGETVDAVPVEKTRSFTLGDVQSDRALQLADDGGRQLYEELNNSAVYSRLVKGDPELEKAYNFIFDDTKNMTDEEAINAFSEKFDVEDLARRYADEELKTRGAAIDWLDENLGGELETSYMLRGTNDFEIVEYNTLNAENVPLGDGDMDTEHAIYKYYQNEVGKYLKKKYNAQMVEDNQGVTWWEVDVPKDAADKPVNAFGKASIGTLGAGALGSAGLAGGLALGAQPASLSAQTQPFREGAAPQQLKASVRGVELTKEDFDKELRPVVFGEVSNRDPQKKELEIRVILNTALNRLRELRRRGQNATLAQVLSQPNQYQAYGGKQYQMYKAGTSTELDTQKKAQVDQILDSLWQEIQSGSLADNTKGAFFYKHKKNGVIEYDNKPFFK